MHNRIKDMREIDIAAEIASLYYEHHLSQYEIAQKLFYSKSKVSRILKKAQDLKIVEVKINYPLQRVPLLEVELKNKYNLDEVIVTKDFSDYADSDIRIKRLSKMAAEFIDSKLHDGISIGLSWGRTLNQVVNELKPVTQKNIFVVQVLGNAEESYVVDYNSMKLVELFAEKYGGTTSLLYAPLFVKNNIVKKYLTQERLIENALDNAKKVDVLVSGIGGFNTEVKEPTFAGYLSEANLAELKSKGAVGIFCGHFLDIDGNQLLSEFEDNIIGIGLQDIKNIPYVIAVSGGVNKARATHAALKGNYIHCLSTDEFLAQKLLQL